MVERQWNRVYSVESCDCISPCRAQQHGAAGLQVEAANIGAAMRNHHPKPAACQWHAKLADKKGRSAEATGRVIIRHCEGCMASSLNIQISRAAASEAAARVNYGYGLAAGKHVALARSLCAAPSMEQQGCRKQSMLLQHMHCRHCSSAEQCCDRVFSFAAAVVHRQCMCSNNACRHGHTAANQPAKSLRLAAPPCRDLLLLRRPRAAAASSSRTTAGVEVCCS